MVLGLVPLLLQSCGGTPASPTPGGPALSERVVTEHFDFSWSAGDRVDAAWQEAFHDWATRELQVTVTRRISYSKYLSPAHMLARRRNMAKSTTTCLFSAGLGWGNR